MSHPGAVVIIAKKRLERSDSVEPQVEVEAMKLRVEEEMFQKAKVVLMRLRFSGAMFSRRLASEALQLRVYLGRQGLFRSPCMEPAAPRRLDRALGPLRRLLVRRLAAPEVNEEGFVHVDLALSSEESVYTGLSGETLRFQLVSYSPWPRVLGQASLNFEEALEQCAAESSASLKEEVQLSSKEDLLGSLRVAVEFEKMTVAKAKTRCTVPDEMKQIFLSQLSERDRESRVL